MALQYYRVKTAKSCLQVWSWQARTKIYEDAAYAHGTAHLTQRKKLRLFKQWRTIILERKMMRLQYKTLRRITV